MTEFVSLEVGEGVGLVRLDRPPVNAIDHQVGTELHEVFAEAAESPDVGALVIWGGPRIFSAGADVSAMCDLDREQIRPVVTALGDALDLLEAMDKISIAAVNGYALGGGLELALAADLRFLARDAQVGQSEVKLGIIPGAGGTQRIARLAGPGVARDLIYSGRILPASEAADLRLCQRIAEPKEVLDAAMDSARAFASGPRTALAAAKKAIRAATETPGAAGLAREKDLFAELFGSHDQREGMRAFLDKRAPRFDGS